MAWGYRKFSAYYRIFYRKLGKKLFDAPLRTLIVD